MVAEQPCDVHQGSPVDNSHVMNQSSQCAELLEHYPSSKECVLSTSHEQYPTLPDSSDQTLSVCYDQTPSVANDQTLSYDQTLSADCDVPLPVDCDSEDRNVCDGGFCDTNGNYNTNDNVINAHHQSFQSLSEQTDTMSACSDTYTSDYTDSVCSGDSTQFLLPQPSIKKDEVCVPVCMNENLQSTCEPSVVITPASESDPVVENKDCYENKEYTDSVSSHASSTQPLINRTVSMWSFIKEVDVSAPVIGLIDHPGFISSQKDLSSTSNLSFACQKALKYLQDERVASSLLLPGSSKDVSKQPPEEWKLKDDIDHNIVPSGKHTRNLIALSICNCMVFIAIGSLRNLQSSINHEGGVGITSLAVSCFGYVLGSIFSPFLVQNFDPYRCLLASLLPHALFIAANFYPTMWLMVPVSFFQGVSAAVLWNAMSTYVTFLAKGYSEKRNKDYEGVLSRFFGTFCLAYQMYMIFGNLIASLVLTYANPVPDDVSNLTLSENVTNETNTSISQSESAYSIVHSVIANATSPSAFNASSPIDVTMCGANYCHHYTISNSGTVVSDFAKYLLFGIYIACMLIALLIAVFLLEPLNKRLFSSSVMTFGMVKTQVVSIGQFIVNRKFLLLSPLLLFSSMEAGFATAEITKAFITCPIGVHMVGYAMICMGVSASFSAYLSGWLTRFFGRTILLGIVP